MNASLKVGLACLCAVMTLAIAPAAWAQEEEGATGVSEEEGGGESGEDEGLGLGFDAGFSSLYYFRGANLFAPEKAAKQNGMAIVAARYSMGGLTMGWWSGWQVLGDNI